jgi:hypothetical protein
LPNKKVYSTIEKEFVRLFGASKSASKIEPLILKNNMTRVSQDQCDKLIPDNFDFKKLVPVSFTDSSAKSAVDEMDEGKTFLYYPYHHHHHRHHHHHHRRYYH